MIEYRFIKEEELTKELFKDFIRHQIVNDCWRREEGKWVIKPDPCCNLFLSMVQFT